MKLRPPKDKVIVRLEPERGEEPWKDGAKVVVPERRNPYALDWGSSAHNPDLLRCAEVRAAGELAAKYLACEGVKVGSRVLLHFAAGERLFHDAERLVTCKEIIAVVE